MENDWPSDSTTEAFIEEKTDINSQKWAQKRINGLKLIINPILDPKAKELVDENADLRANPTVNLLSTQCLAFDVNSVSEVPNPYSPLKGSLFRSELNDSTIDTPLQKDIEVSAIGAQFMNKLDFCQSLNLNQTLLPNVKTSINYQWKYLLLDADDIKVPGTQFEPIVCSVFIVDQKQIATERWNFYTKSSESFFSTPIHSQHAAFDISSVSDKATLIVTYYRMFQVDNGDVCNNYYKKPTDSQLAKCKQSIASSLNRLQDVWTPFAFSTVRLKSLIRAGDAAIQFPAANLSDKPLTGDYIAEHLEKPKKLQSVAISLKLKSHIQSLTNPNSLSSDYIRFDPVQISVNEPVFQFKHKMIVTLGQAKFDLASKANARNILAEVEVIDQEKHLKIIRNNWQQVGLCSRAFSRCFYHERAPIFDDEFIIELPTSLTSQAYLHINYYHVATQEKEQATRLFATATMPLFDDKGDLIPNGQINIGINYPKTPMPKPTSSNFQQITTRLDSTFDSQNPYIKPMFSKNKRIPAVDVMDDSTKIHYLYQITDSLIDGLYSSQPKAAATSLISYGKFIKFLDQKRLDNLLTFYIAQFALRNKESQNPRVHKELLKQWTEYLNKNGQSVETRDDIPVANFLFMLIFKSIVATQDRQFNNDFDPFFKKVCQLAPKLNAHRARARLFNISFATFVACLSDYGFYELAEKIIIVYSNAFGTTENDYEALVTFLEFALHPKLFIASSLIQFTLIDYFYKLIVQALKAPKISKINDVYRIICRLFLFTPEKDRAILASRYVRILKTFDPKQIRVEGEELRFLLSFIAYIFKYIQSEDFKDFYNNAMFANTNLNSHQNFNLLMHFLLTKSRIPFARPSSEITQSQYDAIQASLNMKQTQIAPEDQIPLTSEAVRVELSNRARSADLMDQANPSLPEVRDLALDSQMSVFNIIQQIMAMNNDDAPELILDVLYHIYSSNICISASKPIKETTLMYIKDHLKYLMFSKEPPYVLFLTKLFSLIAMKNKEASREFVSIIPSIFEIEKTIFPSLNRSLVSSIRAISKMKDSDIESPVLLDSFTSISTEDNTVVNKIIECLQTANELNKDMRLIDPVHFKNLRYKQIVNKASSTETNIEKYGEDIFRRSKSYSISPDACAEEIQNLTQYHNKNEYLSESLMAQIYQIALIVEYLTVLKLIPNPYDGVEHPVAVFRETCNSVDDHICPEEIINDPPLIPGFCDSTMFSMSGIFILIQDIHSYCKRSKLFEISNEVMRLTYPILEKCGLYGQLSKQFQETAPMNYQVISSLSSGMDRMLGRYYRIAFYGEIFGSDDGKMFVQREIKLTHLFDVTNRIKNTYIKLFGADAIEIITESGFVDRRVLNPRKGYIQLTFVEPIFPKREMSQRVTVYECSNKLKMFKFETPFVKGEKKLQGSVETQWQRRTILKTQSAMPSILKRVEVPPEGFIVIEYEPIRVSIRQIKERLDLYEAAIAKNDAQAIQPLLHGSLLVQVNEGPTKMAEVFLGGQARTKYTEKMRQLFQKFLDLNNQGLAIHRRFVQQNPGFQELQNQLEAGYDSLKDKLMPYLYPETANSAAKNANDTDAK